MQCRDIILEIAEEKKDQRQSSATESQRNKCDGEEQTNSLAQDVQKLTISTTDGDPQEVEPAPAPHQHHRRPQSTVVCDAWYGLPKQKRPRKERVNAVARQLRNFEKSALLSARRTSSEQTRGVRVVLVGKESDVKVIGERLEKLREDDGGNDKGGKTNEVCTVKLWPDVSVEEACRRQQNKDELPNVDASATNNNTALDCRSEANRPIYLSPDAEGTLDPRKPPPRTVVVGMLIDRRVQPNRSNERAGKIEVTAARLPMDELKVEGLETNEALNVDTVLEMMVCWWDQMDALAPCDGGGKKEDDDEEEMRRCFINSASAAMVSHEDRHPNRAIHGSGS